MKRLTYEEVKEYIESFGYKLISTEYINNRTPLKIICDEGHEIEMRFDNFKSGKRCKICANNVKYEKEQVESYLSEFNYTLLSEYINCRDEIQVKCDQGHVYRTSSRSLKQDSRCALCNNPSKGELEILSWLEEHDIDYIWQHSFKDCKYRKELIFDFYIPRLNCCIEYDGIQHFEPVDFLGEGIDLAEKRFKETKVRDSIKNNYCNKNNIKIIRIPYWEFDNIKNILNKQIRINFNEQVS